MIKKNNFLSLLGFLFLCYGVAGLESFATHASLDPWYAQLQKPSWNPPTWVFAPVWTFLYFLIAVAGWLFYVSKESLQKGRALFFYFIQLFFNFLWSFLFFYLKSPFLGLIDIVLLILFLCLTIQAGSNVSRWGSLLLIPYLIWTLYAATLNGVIYFLNRIP